MKHTFFQACEYHPCIIIQLKVGDA